MTTERFLQLLNERVLLFDGATGTSLQTQYLTPEDFGGRDLDGCNEYLCISNPQAVRNVHYGFLEAGADIIETNSFGSASIVLAEYGIAEKAYELSRRSAELARACADEYSASTLTISRGMIGRPHGEAAASRCQGVSSVMTASFWLSENGYSAPIF